MYVDLTFTVHKLVNTCKVVWLCELFWRRMSKNTAGKRTAVPTVEQISSDRITQVMYYFLRCSVQCFYYFFDTLAVKHLKLTYSAAKSQCIWHIQDVNMEKSIDESITINFCQLISFGIGQSMTNWSLITQSRGKLHWLPSIGILTKSSVRRVSGA